MGEKVENNSLPDLKPGEWQFANNYTAIWIHTPHTDTMMGLVRLPISKTGNDVPPVWKWDGNKNAPTLTPSINVIGVWHGWLREGRLITA